MARSCTDIAFAIVLREPHLLVSYRQAAHVFHHPKHLQTRFPAEAELLSHVRHSNFLLF